MISGYGKVYTISPISAIKIFTHIAGTYSLQPYLSPLWNSSFLHPEYGIALDFLRIRDKISPVFAQLPASVPQRRVPAEASVKRKEWKSMFEKIYNFTDFIWGIPLTILIVGVGLYLSVSTGFFQITGFRTWWRKTICEIFGKKKDAENHEGQLTPWQAITTVLGGTVGSGNIAGVATAIAVGGPGAVFWMWLIAIVGMLTKMAEVSLSVKYRKIVDGEYYGGPMHYMKAALGKIGKVLAVIYGIALLLDIATDACAIQVSTLADAVNEVFGVPTILVAAVVVVISLIIILSGGVKKVGQVSSVIVPPMVIIYFIGCMGVIFGNIGNLPAALGSVFKYAFAPAPAIGGFAGATVTMAISKGAARGIFSNEAGMGTSATVHATAQTDHPIHQGMFGIFEVFVDTIIVCSLTGLAILCAEVLPTVTEETVGVGMVFRAFEETWGRFGSVILCIAILLFCYSGYLGFFVEFRTCTEWMVGIKASKFVNLLFFVLPILATMLSTLEVWSICDIVVGLVIVPNLIALLLLSPKFLRLFREYKAKLQEDMHG